jgi:adenylate cyclase
VTLIHHPVTSNHSVTGAIAFVDLCGFTAYTARHGDVRALALVEHLERALADIVPPRGRIVKHLGDGALLWFDDIDVAVTGMVRLARRMTERKLRAGIHFGTAVAHGDDLLGHDVNVAARIARAAGPGQVLCSDAGRVRMTSACADVRVRPAGVAVLRGITAGIPVFRLDGSPVTTPRQKSGSQPGSDATSRSGAR